MTSFALALLLAQAATPAAVPPDSASDHRRAVEAQAAFERTRAWHAPLSWWSGGSSCDERIGRFCLRFGTDDPDEDRPSWTPPDEAPEVVEARTEFMSLLAEVAGRFPGNGWVAGQRVAYLGEIGAWESALAAAQACRAEEWWCDALLGHALHGSGRIAEAEDAFARVEPHLGPDDLALWSDPVFLGSLELMQEERRLSEADRALFRERIWRLADPLFLLEGNVLRSEHRARWVLAQVRAESRNGHGLPWGRDLRELLLRYGPVVAYERVHEVGGVYTGPPPTIGRYSPDAWHLIPSLEAILDPGGSGSDDWRTDRRQARSRHTPPQAPRLRAMEVQTARFRRGDDLLALAAWELATPPDSGVSARGAFLLDTLALEPRPQTLVDIEDHRGVVLARAPAGGYLLSIEALDAAGTGGWRHREGVRIAPPLPGMLLVSDLLLLEPDARGTPEEASLEEVAPRARRSTQLPPGPVEVAWELYGVPPGGMVLGYRLRAERTDRGLLRRAGEALRLVPAPAPIELRWEEGTPVGRASPDEPLLRTVVLDFSGLESGDYLLTLSVDGPGRRPVVSERNLRVEPERMDGR